MLLIKYSALTLKKAIIASLALGLLITFNILYCSGLELLEYLVRIATIA